MQQNWLGSRRITDVALPVLRCGGLRLVMELTLAESVETRSHVRVDLRSHVHQSGIPSDSEIHTKELRRLPHIGRTTDTGERGQMVAEEERRWRQKA